MIYARNAGARSVASAVYAAVLAVVLTGAAACSHARHLVPAGPRPADIVIDADAARVLEFGSIGDFHMLVGGQGTPVDPATARVVGPKFSVDLDATAVVTSINDAVLFESLENQLAPDDVSGLLRHPHRVTAGYELLFAHVPDGGRLPEPLRGYPTIASDPGWQVLVGGQRRPLTEASDTFSLQPGSIVVVSVPVGLDAYLLAANDDWTEMISLRTGRVVPA
ncbi:hypothetical protein [Pseudofrankia inefficax]|uniref:hypothetical protein n=1 Tax=Pseudofrankia inefficax (strain DSM 45817 / CECT 9037 / DDB 130130 / EuI1c) TaxID=298654 RepID=UPI0001BFB221|nr:hypothetical protein [Pseudofrankia inefficax]